MNILNIVKLIVYFFCVIPYGLTAQSLKTFNGSFADGRSQNGTAVYTYYEDQTSHEYVKHGSFKYNFVGKGNYEGFNQTITGKFENGLRNGLWSQQITMKDFGASRTYWTGTVSLTSNYKDGYADGQWKQVINYKARQKYYRNGVYVWGEWGPLQTTTIIFTFKDGAFSGPVSITDNQNNYAVSGRYNNGYPDSSWKVKKEDGGNVDMVYNNKILYQLIERDNTGSLVPQNLGDNEYVKFIQNDEQLKLMNEAMSMSDSLQIENGYSFGHNFETSKVIPYINNYISKILEDYYFLYKYIGGDLTYSNGIFYETKELKVFKGAPIPRDSKGNKIKLINGWESSDYTNFRDYLLLRFNQVVSSDSAKVLAEGAMQNFMQNYGKSIFSDDNTLERRKKELDEVYKSAFKSSFLNVNFENLNANQLGSLGWYCYEDGKMYYNANGNFVGNQFLDSAILLSQKSIEKDSSLIWVKFNLGLFYLIKGDINSANSFYQNAIVACSKMENSEEKKSLLTEAMIDLYEYRKYQSLNRGSIDEKQIELAYKIHEILKKM